jgi:subtilase family serine protease/fibronectin type 3 domain-containing protein
MRDCGNPLRSVRPSRRRAGRRFLAVGPLLVLLGLIALMTGPAAQAAPTPCADLVASSVTTAPAPPVQGQPANVVITVKNNGTCAAGAFSVNWRPSLFGAPQPAVPVSGLAAGATTTVNVPYTFPQTGLVISLATVDSGNTVPETNEGNNSLIGTTLVASPVDLVVSSLTVGSGGAVAGIPTTASITVTNQGTAAAGGFRVDWAPGNGTPAQSRQVAGLGAGASTTLTIPYTYASNGTFGSTATVDAGNTVAESNELNNTKLQFVTVVPKLADLVVTNVTTDPNPAFAGSSVLATITVANQGFAPAGAFNVQWWPWLAAAPVSTQVSGLAPGASTTVTLNSVFAYTGTFDGTVTVDNTNTVPEVNELNNTFATHVTGITPTLNVQRIMQGGFGDFRNNYSWSMAWFNGKLYVGTARMVRCVENETLDFFFPTESNYQGLRAEDPEDQCPADPYDMDLRAEIWQYTPETNSWARVYQSPVIPNPRASGKTIGLDIGYRDMQVYTDPSTGKQALYVLGVTAGEYIPEIAQNYRPTMLMTTDGTTFTQVPNVPQIVNTAFGAQNTMGFRASTVWNNRLFVTMTAGLLGDGEVFEVKNPSGSSPTFTQETPSSWHVYEMATFNNTIYVGNGDNTTGYSVWKLVNDSTTPFTWAPVVTNGAGRGNAITSVVSMHVYKGRLYVGANGWGGGGQPAAEEIRINPDDSWDVVVGNARTLPDGTVKAPISGIGDSFGNLFNAHMWRAEDHNGAMYIGTNDASTFFDPTPGIGPLLESTVNGFDIWGTCDGQYFWQVTHDAFGDGHYNFGARTIVSTPVGLFIGSTNHAEGLSVWLGNASPCGVSGNFGSQYGPKATELGTPQSSPVARPARLMTAARPCGTALTWDPVAGARRYRILRATYRSVTIDARTSPMAMTAVGPDLMPTPAQLAKLKLSARRELWIPGKYTAIATTTKTTFADTTAKPGGRYSYEIVAIDGSGAVSQPSNVATVPTAQPTFSDLEAAVQRLSAADQAAAGASLLRLATAAKASWQQDGPAASVKLLDQLRSAVGAQRDGVHGASASAAMSDVKDAIFRLERSAALHGACKP